MRLLKRDRRTLPQLGDVGVVAPAQVLHERATTNDDSSRSGQSSAPNQPQAGLEPAVVALDTIVHVRLDVEHGEKQLLDQCFRAKAWSVTTLSG